MKKCVTKLFRSILALLLAAMYVQKSSNKTIAQGVAQPWNSPFLMLGKYRPEIINPVDLAHLKKTSEKMLAERHTLNPGQMFALSARLYSLGAKDEGVYWFYHGQYRARLFHRALKDYSSVRGRIGNKTFELWSVYNTFMKLNGTYLNGYAGCDIEKMLITIKQVRRENEKIPELDKIFSGVVFKSKEKWSGINSIVSIGMGEYIKRLEEMKPNWKKLRAQNRVDEKYCN